MSIESFNAFMAKLATEDALRDELKAAHKGGIPIDQLASVAAKLGFSFDARDVTSELSEKELDSVAGGATLTGLQKISPVSAGSAFEWKCTTDNLLPGANVLIKW